MPKSRQLTEQQNADGAAAQDRTKDEFTLVQMTRIMDVASTLRKERITVEKQLNLDETKRELRERLIEAASFTGEKVSEEEIDAAVRQYFDSLYEYREPTKGPSVWFAHIYIRRGMIGTIAAVIVGVLVVYFVWSTWSAASRANRAENLWLDFEEHRKTIVAMNDDPDLAEKLSTTSKTVEKCRDAQDFDRLEALVADTAATRDQMEAEYRVVVVAGGGQQSGIDRYFTDEDGQRASGYYLIVEAQDASGDVRKLRIRNRETDKESIVAVWAERVPKEVYDRIARDKQEDGVLDERLFAVKDRGEMEPKPVMPGADGEPLKPLGRITTW